MTLGGACTSQGNHKACWHTPTLVSKSRNPDLAQEQTRWISSMTHAAEDVIQHAQ